MEFVDQQTSCDVSVTLLTRNAGPLFARVLEGLRMQETARRVELVVVDTSSSDGTVEAIKDCGGRVETIARDDFDFGRTRDEVFGHTRGDIILSLSQDSIPAHPDWLENLIRPLEDPEVAVASGSSIPDPDRPYPQFAWEKNGYFYFTREMKKFVARYGKGISFSNAAIRRSVWEKLRIDPQPQAEDFQFQTKLYVAGLKTAFPTDAPVLHHHDYTLRQLYRRCRNEGLASRCMGIPYNELDLLRDLASPRKYIQWARELKRGSLNGPAAVLFPLARPIAVYTGARLARGYRDHTR